VFDHAGFRTHPPISQEPASLFVRLPVIYEGPEYPDFIVEAANDPPGVPTWQIRVTDIERAMERCQSADISFELEHNDPGARLDLPAPAHREHGSTATPPASRQQARPAALIWLRHQPDTQRRR
jgi:hypothetical protein